MARLFIKLSNLTKNLRWIVNPIYLKLWGHITFVRKLFKQVFLENPDGRRED
ncbi:MAG: hypothetical protein KKD48_03110 [Nanoarchaeota archaeon]|nr:hypothetical protein [Nanoarchaeota archaeon]